MTDINQQNSKSGLKGLVQFIFGVSIVAILGWVALQFIPGVDTPDGWHTVHPPDDVMAMVEYQGNVWSGGRDGLYVIDPKTFEVIEVIDPEIPLAYVSALLVDPDGRTLWVGHLNGLSSYNGIGWRHLSSADGLPANQVLALGIDRHGRLLVGTTQGLAIQQDGRWLVYSTADGLASNSVDVIAVDSDDQIWLGSRNSQDGGVSVFDGEAWTTLTTEDGLPHNSVNSIFFAEDGSTYIGCGFSHLGGLVRWDGHTMQVWTSEDGLPSNHIRLIYMDRLNIIWISTEYSGIIATSNAQPDILITPDNGLVGWEVKTMLMDRDGALWFGTERGITVIEGWAYDQLWN
jgi:ligand-binding sensor domain-containing protein